MRIAITGARGLIGTSLSDLLQKDAHEVRCITRRPQSPDDIPWNPDLGQLAPQSLEGIEAVVHLAGESVAAGRWTENVKARIRDSRVRGTALLSATLAQLSRPPSVLVCASAIGYYGNRGDELVDEDSSAGQGFLAEVCQQWEAAAEPARQAGIRVVHLRIGVVLSRQGGALAKMLPPFRWGLGGVIGSGNQYWSWVELHELAQMFRFALAHPDLVGAVNAVSPHPVTNREFTRTLGRVLHRPTVLPMPAWLARLALGEMADELLLASTRVEPARFKQAGYHFLFCELEPALQAALS